ncbi:MAG: NTP transferase domain-containing protein [Deltaproteobacteria bacterium]|nr:NTP transferase domain-containing protein [Deltaproteobacteria bacterium]
MSERAAIVIQARTGSSRLPGKALAPLAGASLLERVVERVLAAETNAEVIVATTRLAEDDDIRAVCKRRGFRCHSGNPTDLLARHVEAARTVGADVLVKIPSDCPLIDPAVVRRVLGFAHEHAQRYDFVSNLLPPTYPNGQDVEVVSMKLACEAMVQATAPHEREHTTPFFWERPGRFRLGNVAWERGIDASRRHRWTVDYPEDHALVAAIYAVWSPSSPVFGIDAILDFLAQNPDIDAINAHQRGDGWRRRLRERDASNSERSGAARSSARARVFQRGRVATVTPPADDFDAERALALRVREHVVRMATGGGCFLGASLSCADIVAHLYSRVLRVDPERPDDPARDYFLLSKGHDVPTLYATLAERGFFEVERLGRHLQPGSHLYWHPNRAIPGVEFHSGSLGHLLAVGAGIALDIRLRGGDGRVFVLLGDGELDEGSIWETLLVAAAQKLDNLVAIVDRNRYQANCLTEELVPLEPLGPKFEAFGCGLARIDGHDFGALDATFRRLPIATGCPSVVVCDTVRGKGLPSLEGRVDRWFVDVSSEEVLVLLAELRGESEAELASEPLLVR